MNKGSSDILPKHKDKHNKLRETIEKLKAKSEITDTKPGGKKENEIESEKTKENRDNKKSKKNKTNKEEKTYHKDYEDNDDKDGTKNKNKTKNTNLDDLTLATEQTLKDINKWLDDTSPKFCENSPTSNSSPSHFASVEETDTLTTDKKKNDKVPLKTSRVDNTTTVHKELPKKRNVIGNRDPTKYFKRREVQRTIDRLQPGKSKGNLLSNVQTNNKSEENIFPLLGPLAKIKDSKNSLIVKTDDNAPKLSLGSVLDNFGKHKFVDDQKKDETDGKDNDEKPDVKLDESLSANKTDENLTKDEDKSNIKTDNIALE